jgi:hypothetical protein
MFRVSRMKLKPGSPCSDWLQATTESTVTNPRAIAGVPRLRETQRPPWKEEGAPVSAARRYVR